MINKKIKNSTISFFQFLAYFILYIPLRLIYRNQHFYASNIEALSRGSLIIANHQCKFDPFIIMGNLPFFVFLRIIPARFPTKQEFMEVPFFGFFLKFLGCYSVGTTKKEKMGVLLRTCEFLRNGETIFLFPEGSISHSKMKGFQKGIEFFMKEAGLIIFVRLEGFNDKIRNHLLSSKRKIFYGEVREPGTMELNAEKIKQYFNLLSGEYLQIKE